MPIPEKSADEENMTVKVESFSRVGRAGPSVEKDIAHSGRSEFQKCQCLTELFKDLAS